jgi:hypothetical protein
MQGWDRPFGQFVHSLDCDIDVDPETNVHRVAQ